jgi:hypothetical protein
VPPGRLTAQIPAHLKPRYPRRVKSTRLPTGEAARKARGEQAAAEGT